MKLKSKLSIVIVLSLVFLGFALSCMSGCAQLQTAQTSAQAWSNSQEGQIVLAGVKVAAAAFEPQFAGVIGQAIDSVQTGKIPSASVIAAAVGAATGNSPTASKVAAIASAVVAAAQSAPSPVAGMNAASAAVNGL